ncbi:Constitutive coactivator of PPAR-gamma-like protein 2 [Portunus trituberculatus]|uniref:Constitutive coactivator of PPAR-gamma-like protein 2 n=1 Tax=Portunus trituberculatus TaxID=210409 RepID=A0A5B7E6Q6_PORTR|nr:Constitutive coactivator of PPAR-gamma-like protein 2 [Portunus trituberculatus]
MGDSKVEGQFIRMQSSSPIEGNHEAGPQIDPNPLPLPPVPHEVMRTASERHQKGLMCPWIYQVLTQVCIIYIGQWFSILCTESGPHCCFEL